MKLLTSVLTGLMSIILVVFTCTNSMAQETAAQKYFIYIQNESGSPFYVKKDNKVLSSTPAGYLIIPELKAGKYQITVGLPGNQVAEASFNISISGEGDKGYLLKAADKTLQLLALKDLSVVKPVAMASAAGNRIVDEPVPEESKPVRHNANNSNPDKTDDLLAGQPAQNNQAAEANTADSTPSGDTSGFAKMLNEITGKNSPQVAQATPAAQAAPQPDSSPSTDNIKEHEADKGEEKQVSTDTSVSTKPQEEEPKNEFERLADSIQSSDSHLPEKTVSSREKVVSQKKPDTGKDLSFITFPDAPEKGRPTKESRAVIPEGDASATGQEDQNRLDKEQRRQERMARKEAKKAKEQASDTGFSVASSSPAANEGNTEANQSDNNGKPAAVGIPNSDCQKLADEDLFQKVRRKMASRNDDEGIFRIAEKYLKDNVCYSSAQIQSLTYLFVSDEYKYKFLELAYPHVYDTGHFPALVKTLGTSYYKGRFNALVGH